MVSLLSPLYERLHEELPHILQTSLLGPDLLQRVTRWACHLGHNRCVREALQFFRHWMNHTQEGRLVKPHIRHLDLQCLQWN